MGIVSPRVKKVIRSKIELEITGWSCRVTADQIQLFRRFGSTWMGKAATENASLVSTRLLWEDLA
jgi:hypothetical protein